MGVHDGHRQNMREEFISGGLDAFSDHRVLELLLFYAIPQMDVNPIAHRLLTEFGSPSGVFDADMDELMRVQGIGQNAAVLIKLIPQLCRRYLISKTGFINIIDSTETAGRYLMPRFFGVKEEMLYLLCMDSKQRLLNCVLIGRGSVSTAAVSVRKVAEVALVQGASSVILAHNHVSGIALASGEDRETTLVLRDVLASLDIILLDHIVMGGTDFTSMRDDGLLREDLRRGGKMSGKI